MTTQAHTRRADFDPADYRVVAILDEGPEGGWAVHDDAVYGGRTGRFGDSITDEFAAEVENVEIRCVHCGRISGFRFLCFVRHIPSGELVMFGSGCVAEAFALNRDELKMAELGKAAALRQKRAAWEEANPEAAAALDEYEARDDLEDSFLDDLSRARRLYGALTAKQTEWCTKALAKAIEWKARREQIEAERAAEIADAEPLAEGRYEVEGEIVGARDEENDFGTTTKILVKLADGNKVWGSAPKAIFDQLQAAYRERNGGSEFYGYLIIDAKDLKGLKVKFTATIERSQDDEHFGFYKRPSKAEVTEDPIERKGAHE